MANAAGRARLIAAAVSMLLVGAVVPARAASDVSHDRWDDVFVEPAFCGSRTVTIHDVGHGTTRAYESDEGFPLFAGTVRATVTFTDTDGDAVRSDVAGQTRDLSVTNNGDGTITVVTAITGKAERLRGDDGSRLSMDVGRLVFANVLHFNGTTDPSDDEFISGSIVDVAGPHPNADSDFTLFCDVVLGYFDRP